jgi:uncharacterized membrane protein YbhN (UPF0104 family)
LVPDGNAQRDPRESARLNRRRLLRIAVLTAGLAGIVFVVHRTIDDTRDQVMPHPAAIAVAGGLTLIAVLAGGRAWAALFGDVLDDRIARQRMAGTYYSSQLTKYLPAGGAVQAVSQVSLATATGMPLGRVALAFPVLAVAAVVAGITLGAGLVFASELPAWARVLALMGLVAPVLLRRRLLARVLTLLRRIVHRIPTPERLPSQRSIWICYTWILVNLAAYSAAYAVLVRSLSSEVGAVTVFCAFAVSWVAGFIVLPLPAGVGVREAALVAIVPTLGAPVLLAASLAHRLLSIAAEVLAVVGSGVAARLGRRGSVTDRSPAQDSIPSAHEVAPAAGQDGRSATAM